ncbi:MULTISPECIES: LPXTG cell wall anchor domain-containing protein [Enterococcus]|uniref:Gram-positive cocci surface proteins LPxTG domain-containing protein n=1 Tax=Candidatus Enterococcus mangumiae TaxID=2230878 RepID=A0ABZ2T270_9ENTE|nr:MULTISPECIES: LPXTG cell wall anchor domain-containing protein [unclassified Enterococcus]
MMYYMVGALLLCVMSPTIYHAQQSEIQTVHVEATIGDLGNSSENQDDTGQDTQNGEQKKEQQATVPVSSKSKGSSSKFPQTGEHLTNGIALIGLLLTLFSIGSFYTFNQKEDRLQKIN